MLEFHHIYQINEIPDVDYLEYQKICPTGVPESISMHFQHLLNRIAILKADDAEATLRVHFRPASGQKSLQSRMNIFLILKSRDKVLMEDLKTIIEKGILNRFYKFISVGSMDISWNKLNEISVITRRENIVKPSVSNDLNYQVPSCYYSIQPIKFDVHNWFMDLDKICDEIGNEIIIIDVAVKPVDIRSYRVAHARYLSALDDINSTWGINNHELSQVDYFDNNQSSYSRETEHILKPLAVKDPVADETLSKQRRFHETLYKDHLAFNIRIFSETPQANSLITSCIADSAFENGSYQSFSSIKGTKKFESVFLSAKHLCFYDTVFSKLFLQAVKEPVYNDLAPLNQCATIEELSGIFRLPVAVCLNSPCCIRKNTDPKPVPDKIKAIPLGSDEEIRDFSIELPLPVICKHIGVFGMSGSGKTTLIQNLMINLWNHGIPFIVFETAKTEYRNMKICKDLSGNRTIDLARHLQIYTLDNEKISPFRINPLMIPENVSKENHIAALLKDFQSTVPMSGPLPGLIKEALERVYERFPDRKHPPLVKDLLNTVQTVLHEKSYSPETLQDILTAIEVRLEDLARGSIGKVFQCRQNIPAINELSSIPSIIEMNNLSSEQKCFLILNILTRIKEDIKSSFQPGDAPRFVIFIEEAHNVIGRSSNTSPSPDNPDPKSYSTDLICTMLAELRSLGAGIVIIDQQPSALAPQVIKNTGTKFAFRQADREERETVGSAMILKDYEKQDLNRLRPGMAYWHTEGMYRARRFRTFNLHEKYDFGPPLQDEQLHELISRQDWFIENSKKRIAGELLILQEQMDIFDDFRIECTKRIAVIMARFPRIPGAQSPRAKAKQFAELKSEACRIRDALSSDFDSFIRDFYNKYLPPALPSSVNDSELAAATQATRERFSSTIRPDFRQLLKIMDAFIIKCEEAADNAQYE